MKQIQQESFSIEIDKNTCKQGTLAAFLDDYELRDFGLKLPAKKNRKQTRRAY